MRRLIYIITGLIIILADAGGFRAGGNFFIGYGILEPLVFATLVKYLLFGLMLFCVILNQFSPDRGDRANFTNALLLIFLLLLILMSVFSVYYSNSLIKAISTEVRHLGIISIGSLLLVGRLNINNNPAYLIMLGVALGYPIRWVHGLIQFSRGEGVSIGGVVSSVFDAGPLLSSIFLSFILLENIFSGDRKVSLVKRVAKWLGFTACIALLILSFRRAPLFSFSIAFLGGLILYFCAQRAILSAVKAAAGIAALAFLGCLLSIALFGLETSVKRLESISLSSSGGYAFSNQFYIDDWAVTEELIENTFPLGIGFGTEYGLKSRLVMLSLAEIGVDPVLHSGFGELVVRTGVFGFLFWVLNFIGIPIFCLLRFLKSRSRVGPSYYCYSVYVLFLAIFPFQPPPYCDVKTSIFISLALGLSLSKVAELELLHRR